MTGNSAREETVAVSVTGVIRVVRPRLDSSHRARTSALFYAVTLQPFPAHCTQLSAYFERLVERPSVRRTLEEATPYFKDYPFESAIATRFR